MRNLIWSLGWRNPWRFTFDDTAVGGTGAMILGDVGQNAWEEVDYEPAGQGGRNYGWRVREGAHLTSGISDTTSATLTDPIIEYSHAVGRSVPGGRVNRGTGLGLNYFGRYFFADLNGRVWSARFTLQAGTTEALDAELQEHTAELGGASAVGMPVAFGTDASCRVYIVDYTDGRVLRLLPDSLSTVSTCATPAPFVNLGGGTFLGNGWVPPGHPLATPTPTPSPTPTPTPTPTPPACVTPGPFQGIPGLSGVCVNGGWVPAGHPLARRGG